MKAKSKTVNGKIIKISWLVKKIGFVTLTLLVAGTLALCKQKQKEEENCTVSSVTYSLCEPEANEEGVASLQEYIKYSAADGQTLRFEQGIIINCCCDSISVKTLSSDQNTVVVDVCDYGIGCNCVCLGHVKYNITGFRENDDYAVTFKRNGRVCYSTSVTIAVDMDETITLNKED
jgi:hypothetical protein